MHRKRVDPSVLILGAALLLLLGGLRCAVEPEFDVILRGGTVYDGSGDAPVVADVALRDDRIAAIGDLSGRSARTELDVEGLAVAPGFINMLSWSTFSLILDGTSQSEIRQGVTLQVFGEGLSMGPVNERVRNALLEQLPPEVDIEIDWETLDEYLQSLVRRGVSPNVASFVGATTLRIHTIGFEDRPATPAELDEMRGLTRQAMEQGALGVGSSLIYAPAFYANTEELIALSAVAAEYGGIYISHLRSEGSRLLESIDELVEISRISGAPAEIYHLKAAGRSNHGKLEAAIARVERARAEGLQITANIYTYPAAATGLDASMPPWVQEGGFEEWARRLADPRIRKRVAAEMNAPTDEWENLFLETGAEGMLLVGFRNPELRHLTGRTLAEVAEARGASPAETAMDLVVEDASRVGTVYFVMTEENVARKMQVPWVSFGSDEESQAPEEPFLQFRPHPRAYGTFARVLGRYVRDEGLLPLESAIHRMTGLPAANLGLSERGRLADGLPADVVVFDPATIADHATFDDPHRYATGMRHVFVNGAAVLLDGEHTGAKPGRVVRGSGAVQTTAAR